MDYKKVNKSLVELGNLLVRYGKEKNIIYVDLGNILLKQGNGNIEEYYLEDGIHVSKEIHKEMAEIIYKGLF